MDQFWSNSIHFSIIYVWFKLPPCSFIIEIVTWQTLWDNRLQYVYNAINWNAKFIKSQKLFIDFWNWKPRCNLSSNLMNGLWFGTMMEFQPCYGFSFSFKCINENKIERFCFIWNEVYELWTFTWWKQLTISSCFFKIPHHNFKNMWFVLKFCKDALINDI